VTLGQSHRTLREIVADARLSTTRYDTSEF